VPCWRCSRKAGAAEAAEATEAAAAEEAEATVVPALQRRAQWLLAPGVSATGPAWLVETAWSACGVRVRVMVRVRVRVRVRVSEG
jgi:hypothetical protein